jgi:hypothetical protein
VTNRDASAAYLTELAKAINRPVHLLEAAFDSGSVRNTDAYRDIVWKGKTYIANGHFIQIEDLAESATLQMSRVKVTLSGVDQSWLALILSQAYDGRALRIWRGFLSDTFTLIQDPVQLFEGTMDEPIIEDDPSTGTSIVQVVGTDIFKDWERPRGRLSNDQSQQFHFPGDRGMEFATGQSHAIFWGNSPHRPSRDTAGIAIGLSPPPPAPVPIALPASAILPGDRADR